MDLIFLFFCLFCRLAFLVKIWNVFPSIIVFVKSFSFSRLGRLALKIREGWEFPSFGGCCKQFFFVVLHPQTCFELLIWASSIFWIFNVMENLLESLFINISHSDYIWHNSFQETIVTSGQRSSTWFSEANAKRRHNQISY